MIINKICKYCKVEIAWNDSRTSAWMTLKANSRGYWYVCSEGPIEGNQNHAPMNNLDILEDKYNTYLEENKR